MAARGLIAAAQPVQLSANDLVRATVANELKAANAPGHYMYRMRIERAHETQLKEVMETKDWLIGRLIQIDGRPLTAEQERKEEERLSRLLGDKRERQQEAREQQANERQVRNLLRALPQAFLYRYVDSKPGNTAPGLELLSFEPNPRFHALSRRLEVLAGMRGTMLIDSTAKRLVRLQGGLFRGVDFGWGVLAHLDRGGKLLLEQRDLGRGRWAVTTLSLHFTGKLLILKPLRIDITTHTSQFRRMPDNLTLIEGLEVLKNHGEMTN